MPPRALNPAGIVLVDKPGGPSSFAIVSDLRRRTGARTGHAGTLDPFATGLLLLLSGSATRLASCFVGLDKRYVTDVDLTARTSTGDPEGDVSERLEAPTRAELDGTYVRAIADALGGHCRTLRRLEIGPFSVDEADPGRFIPADEALARL